MRHRSVSLGWALCLGLVIGVAAPARAETVEEIAGLALYLTSDLARSITGAILAIDGGWTAA